jgi:hypothetical protein
LALEITAEAQNPLETIDNSGVVAPLALVCKV